MEILLLMFSQTTLPTSTTHDKLIRKYELSGNLFNPNKKTEVNEWNIRLASRINNYYQDPIQKGCVTKLMK